MKTKSFAVMAMSALLFAACSQQADLAPQEQNAAAQAMSFSAGRSNTTRTGLEEVNINDFGVFTYKNMPTAALVMYNYKVEYQNVNPGEDHGWVYDGVTGDNLQYLKYWDVSATSYDFFAYAPFKAGMTLEGTTINLGNVEAGYAEDANALLIADNKGFTAFGNDVPLQFRHLNGQVRLAFYEEVAGYGVTMNGLNITASGDITTSGDLKYDYSTGTSTWENGTKDDTDLSFDGPVGDGTAQLIATQKWGNSGCMKTASSQSATIYYCVPSDANDANGALTFTISYKLRAEDTNEIIEITGKTVTIPVDYTAWKENTIYTYVFKITDSDLTPIVFDDVTVTDYTVDGDSSDETWDVTTGTHANEPEPTPVP